MLTSYKKMTSPYFFTLQRYKKYFKFANNLTFF